MAFTKANVLKDGNDPMMDILQQMTGPSVLIIEDDPIQAFDLDDFLTAQGFSVMGPVSTIDAALGLLMQQRPDLAVLDLDLRGKNATPVAAALRKYGVPFVVASGAEHLEQLLDKRTVFSDIPNVGKPIRGGRLVKILETLLHTKALH